MNFIYFFHGILIGIMATAPLGPISIMVIQRTTNKGIKGGMALAGGSILGDFLFAIIAGFGLTFISNFIIDHQTIIRVVGGGFVVYIAMKIYYANPAKQARKQNTKGSKLFQDFLTSIFITLSNPVILAGYGGLFAAMGVVKNESTSTNMFLALAGVIAGACIWWASLITIVNLFKKKITFRKLWWINKITGVCVGIVGLFLILSSFL